MKLLKLIPALLLAASAQTMADESLETEAAKFSYAAGVYSVRGIKPLIDSQAGFDKEIYLQGIAQALEGDDTLITEDEMRSALVAAEEKRAKEFEATQIKVAQENLVKGQAFRDEYMKHDGVVKTDSGLLYKVVNVGEGESPVKEDTVVVHYAGRLIDGTEFDSSIKRGEPATFPLANVIPGWTEIVQLMKPGGKFEVVIPAELAYGERGAGAQISPNSTLVFDIELVEVKEPAEVIEPAETNGAEAVKEAEAVN